ncbi:hypothetical protein SSPSH_001997 [Salinisphaera shabanensis E1L3A]|uniref:Uncharacterized protein n=1 Tax=Salinisphaera shabanensis E1L3A TaxID=1033802 RepID=U2FYC7_9GAMM|nr:hypothetical protein SSPSH_001997 [Salinisphaera shabanensis E1L3A]
MSVPANISNAPRQKAMPTHGQRDADRGRKTLLVAMVPSALSYIAEPRCLRTLEIVFVPKKPCH